VQGWVTGAPNNGLVLEAANNATATAGAAYYSPTASAPAANLPQLTVAYVTPTPRGAPPNLNVTPGDGGVEVSWNAPRQGDTPGVTGYTAKAVTSAGTVAASATPNGPSAVLTGLTNGQAYTIKVTATNAEGTGPAATATGVTPAAVASSAADIQAVQQFLNSQTALQEGQYPTAPATVQAMTNNGNQAAMIGSQLNSEQLFDASFTPLFNAYDVAETGGTSALSNTLVVPVNGGGAQVYATDDLTYNTLTGVGTSTQASTGSEALTDYLFTISGGSSPAITGYVDADAATYQVSKATDSNASATTLNDIPQLPPGLTPPSAATLSAGSESGSSSHTSVNRAATANWAVANYNGSDDGFGEDCTDFASRAIYYGGGEWRSFPPAPWWNHISDDRYWWFLKGPEPGSNPLSWSHSWAVAADLAYHFWAYQDTYFLHHMYNADRGDIIFADLNPDHDNDAFYDINHTGVISSMSNGIPLIAQHSPGRKYESVIRWINRDPGLTLYITNENPGSG